MRQIGQDAFIATRGFYAFLPCRAAVVSQILNCTAGIVRRHRKSVGSRWRQLDPCQQALLVPAYLREGKTFAAFAAGLGATPGT